MNTQFWIQVSNPLSTGQMDLEDVSLSDAVQTAFPADTEELLLRWNQFRIPIGYKYDFSFMIGDIVDLCNEMLDRKTGERRINWASSTFNATWNIRWDERVELKATWRTTLGGLGSLLDSEQPVTMLTSDFLAEWKKPLHLVNMVLLSAGYRPGQVHGLRALAVATQAIPKFGRLYRKPELERRE